MLPPAVGRGPFPTPVGPVQRYRCPSCHQEIFFRNTACLACGIQLLFDPDRGFSDMAETGHPCANRGQINCNWSADEPGALCLSCQHTTVVPDLSVPANIDRWERIETVKRPLILMLHRLGLPLFDEAGMPVPRFELKAKPETPRHRGCSPAMQRARSPSISPRRTMPSASASGRR